MRIFPMAMCHSAYEIDYEALWDRGYRAVIYDIDNTLTEHGEAATERAVKLFALLRDLGYRACVVSNNKEKRVKPFAEAVGCEYVYKAGKPLAKGYMKAAELMDTDPSSIFVVGDQLFTDIWGATAAGMKSIMVDRIARHEEIQIHLKRIPERVIVFIYRITHRKRGELDLL